MNLQIHTDQGISTCQAREDRSLSDSLQTMGIRLNLRCGGNGRCGRCKIVLINGDFFVNGKMVSLQADETLTVNSCNCFPVGEMGEIIVPASSLAQSNSIVEVNFSPLPDLTGGPGGLAVAVDIGTTTAAALLIDNGKIVATAGMLNQQCHFGDNVIDRITACRNLPDGQLKLHRAIIEETINPLLAQLVPYPNQISRMAVAANTVMTHLFYNESPISIGVSPFTPKFRKFPQVTASSLGVAINPKGEIIASPAISGNVGGDITSGLIATNFGALGGTELLVDLGTNCEIVLSHCGKVWATSAAAGSAFEGGKLSSGCFAAPGVIEHLSLSVNGKLDLQITGNEEPAGLCGSALIDFLAEGRKAGAIDEHGRLELGVLRRWGRLVTSKGENGFRIAKNIIITESDIEELSKAKAAVAAGITSLLRHAGAKVDDIQKIYLCGGFARNLNINSAQAIGMLPKLMKSIFQICGNTSLAGAAILAARPDRIAEYEKWLEIICDLPLNLLEDFEQEYIDNLILP